jgi:glycosyltransferase involved in cell wall biosynthesis
LKINWFSPLPPARSGIAQNFARQLLPALAGRHDVIAWTDQDQVAPELSQIVRVARYQPNNPPWRKLNEADVSVYNLGNHGLIHGGMWNVSQRHAGIVILHDLCLHDFFAMVLLRILEKPDAYIAALERWYGEDGRRAGEAFRKGGISPECMTQEFPLTGEATRGALGAITHSRRALADLKETLACPVIALEHPYVAADESRHHQWLAARTAAARPPYRLVVFGYLSRNRRLEAVLEALAGIPEREQFRLDVCGELWDEGHIRTQIERLGLGSLVKLSGFLPESLVEQKLSTADLAINLRFPSMGEASGSQLQFWDYGLPTLVTRTGWYASLPEGTAAFVRPEYEIEDIKAHLCVFLANPGAFRAMGERGRQVLKSHDPEKYVNALTGFASLALELSPRIPALELAGRVGSDLAQWLHPAASAYLLERASREIFTMCEGKSHDRNS